MRRICDSETDIHAPPTPFPIPKAEPRPESQPESQPESRLASMKDGSVLRFLIANVVRKTEIFLTLGQNKNQGNSYIPQAIATPISEESIQYATDKAMDKKLSANEKAILELITANPSVTQKEMAGGLNLTEDGIYYHFRQTQGQGHVAACWRKEGRALGDVRARAEG